MSRCSPSSRLDWAMCAADVNCQILTKSDRKFSRKPIWLGAGGAGMECTCRRPGVVTMSISLERVVAKYLATKKLSSGTRREYRASVTKWSDWGKGVDVDQIERRHLCEFLDWVHEKATTDGGSNPGRTANKARENLRAILSWADTAASSRINICGGVASDADSGRRRHSRSKERNRDRCLKDGTTTHTPLQV